MNRKARSEKALSDFCKMKKIAFQYYKLKDYDKALRTVFIASGFMYTMNQIQYDNELESLVRDIGKELYQLNNNISASVKNILFYDSIGSPQRGLTFIYIKALRKLGYNVTYVMYDNNIGNSQNLISMLGEEHVLSVKNSTYQDQIISLFSIIDKSDAGRAFLYMSPDDVVAAAVFSNCEGRFLRYLINLTDHAFWLGIKTTDYIINFRQFGGKVCTMLRQIPQKENLYLPYYPEPIEDEIGYDGFGKERYKVIFSGGALYKTESKDNGYYNLVRDILNRFGDTVFVYFGNGDCRKIKRLQKEFPNRIYFESERRDFYNVMKECCIYLSTYPYNGGLMTQYALLAYKVPVTLCCDGIDSELTIDKEKTFWNFHEYDACINEISHLLKDSDYRKNREESLHDFLLDDNTFAEELQYILIKNESKRKINYDQLNFEGFKKFPIESYSGEKYYRLFFRKNGLYLAKFFPLKYFLGFFAMLRERTYKQ